MRKRRWVLALVGSVALHGATLTSALWWASREPRRPSFEKLAVSLVAGAERTGGEPTRLASLRSPTRAPSSSPRRGAAPLAPSTVVRGFPATVGTSPPVSGAAPARGGIPPGGAGLGWWGGRSMTDYVEACRRGNARPDSILDPPPMPEQVALARTTRQLNDVAFRLYGEWRLEKFTERLRENFPFMR